MYPTMVCSTMEGMVSMALTVRPGDCRRATPVAKVAMMRHSVMRVSFALPFLARFHRAMNAPNATMIAASGKKMLSRMNLMVLTTMSVIPSWDRSGLNAQDMTSLDTMVEVVATPSQNAATLSNAESRGIRFASTLVLRRARRVSVPTWFLASPV